MTEIFPICKLGEVASIKSGFAFKSKDMGMEGCPVIKIGNINPPNVDIYNVERVSFDVIKSNARIRKFLLEKGDALVAMTGATVGKLGRFPKTDEAYYLNQRVGKLFLNKPEQANYDFLYYVLSQKKYVEQIFSSADGSAQANVSGGQIEAFKIPLPPLTEQKAIASVLGALDDKIENNRQMNETLEEMARAIFKSWFVDFDPVHAKAAGNAPVHMNAETAALFPSSFGNDGLPLGWNKVSADTICSITIGKTPPRKEHQWFSNSSDDVNWASIRDMGECGTYILQTTEMLTAEAIKKFNVRVVPKNTVILSFKLTVGRVTITDDEIATNEAIAHFGQLDSQYGLIQPEYLYAYLKEFNFDRLGSTSSIATAVNSKTIKAMPIMLANGPCRDAFQKLALPLFSKINCNQKENQTLAKLRDTLLPKLMSGEIRVKDAKQEVEAAV